MRPAHQFDQAETNGEAKTCAAVFASSGHVGLREWLEQFGGLLAGHADPGVPHRELELHLFAVRLDQFDGDADFAAVR